MKWYWLVAIGAIIGFMFFYWWNNNMINPTPSTQPQQSPNAMG